VVMAPTVTLAQSAILSALDFTVGRDTVVMTDLDFPSVRYAFEELVPKLGGRVVVVPTEDGITIDQARLHGAIDERTALVAVSHVAFRSAFILDADALCAHAHAMGALVSLDAYHSVGVIPVDVKRSGVDFLTGGVLKWLCGGPGGCFLYASPSASERFAPSPHRLAGTQASVRLRVRDGLRRGHPSMARRHSGRAGAVCRDGGTADRRGGGDGGDPGEEHPARRRGSSPSPMRAATRSRLPREPDRRGGTVAFDVPHGAEVAQALLARDVVIDYRPGAGIRVAPHFYTTDDEVERVVAEIDDILSTGAWSAFAGSKPRVT
jgi:kynureninase